MRPGGLTKGEKQIRLSALLLTMSISGAEHEARLAHAVIAPTAQDFSQFFGGQIPAAFVQQHGFAGGLRIGNPAPGFRKLGQFYRPGEPLFIARDQLCLGRTGDLATSDYVKKDGKASLKPVAAVCNDREHETGYAVPTAGSLSPNAHIRSRL